MTSTTFDIDFGAPDSIPDSSLTDSILGSLSNDVSSSSGHLQRKPGRRLPISQVLPPDHAETLEWYRLAAEKGDARAQVHLGFIHQQGRGVPQDHDEAVKWYRLAAAQGQYNLAVRFIKGSGVRRDYGVAARWYRLAAEQGHVKAQVSLGNMYSKGIGVIQDHAEAAKWYQLAAAQGDAIAQFNLGVSYVKGLGVDKDYLQAHMWFSIGAEGGDAHAEQTRDTVALKLTALQISEAQKMLLDHHANQV